MRTAIERDIIANYVGAAWAAVVQIAFVPVYIRYLGIETYGLIGVYASLQVILSILDVGLTPTLNREMARFKAGSCSIGESRSLLRTLEIIYFVLAVAIFLSVLAASPWLATRWLHSVVLTSLQVRDAISLMGSLIAFRWLTGLYRGAIMGLRHQVWLNAEIIVFSTLRSAGVIAAMAWIAHSIDTFFVFQAAVTLLEALVLWRKAWHLLPASDQPRFSVNAVRGIWRFSTGVAVITVLALLLTQSDKVLLSRLLSLKAFGYYALASSVAGSLSALIGPVSNVAYPRFSELVARGDEAISESYHRFSQTLSLVLIPGSLTLILFSNEILMLWTRDANVAKFAAPLVSLLVLGTMLNGLMYTPYNLQLAYGWTRFMVYVNCVCVVLFVPALYIAVSAHGAEAAALAWVGLNVCYVVFVVPLMHRKLLPGQQWRWYKSAVAMPAMGALLALIPCHLVIPSIAASGRLASLCALGLAYLAALLGASLSCPVGRELLGRFFDKRLAST